MRWSSAMLWKRHVGDAEATKNNMPTHWFRNLVLIYLSFLWLRTCVLFPSLYLYMKLFFSYLIRFSSSHLTLLVQNNNNNNRMNGLIFVLVTKTIAVSQWCNIRRTVAPAQWHSKSQISDEGEPFSPLPLWIYHGKKFITCVVHPFFLVLFYYRVVWLVDTDDIQGDITFHSSPVSIIHVGSLIAIWENEWLWKIFLTLTPSSFLNLLFLQKTNQSRWQTHEESSDETGIQCNFFCWIIKFCGCKLPSKHHSKPRTKSASVQPPLAPAPCNSPPGAPNLLPPLAIFPAASSPPPPPAATVGRNKNLGREKR